MGSVWQDVSSAPCSETKAQGRKVQPSEDTRRNWSESAHFLRTLSTQGSFISVGAGGGGRCLLVWKSVRERREMRVQTEVGVQIPLQFVSRGILLAFIAVFEL